MSNVKAALLNFRLTHEEFSTILWQDALASISFKEKVGGWVLNVSQQTNLKINFAFITLTQKHFQLYFLITEQ